MASALDGADAIIHSAALHAPHVGVVPDEEFQRINVAGTERIARAALAAGVRRFVFTSMTALYGHSVSSSSCSWIDEATTHQPNPSITAPSWTPNAFSKTWRLPNWLCAFSGCLAAFPSRPMSWLPTGCTGAWTFVMSQTATYWH
ncbi:NAD-dependent epimerase/dehydratase family protein [Rhizobium sp. BK181]|uniref:NAD-dependent epimerase/dehydratase family protein n=1 Tax=Rhizobium sp. BK181 TaxID=2587072 RepID=UPI001FEE5FFB|nr:NAD-dependent epimerase/dehydratase family protein [Rhizobium sp. BK181]